MATGVVKWFSDEKGFGFITPEYELGESPKGPQATNVRGI